MVRKEHVTKGLTKTQYQYTAPHKVTQKFSPVLYELTTEDGTILPERFNVGRLVRFRRGHSGEHTILDPHASSDPTPLAPPTQPPDESGGGSSRSGLVTAR